MDKHLYPVADALCSISDTETMVTFLSEILTETELHDLGLRWELMRQLNKGATQRSIASELHVSLCKVTRGNKILKSKSSITRQLLGGAPHA